MRTLSLIPLTPFLLVLGGCPVWLDENEPEGPPLECRRNADCDPDEVCDAGRCVWVPECTTHADCLPSQLCDLGVCAPRPSCIDDGDCASTEYCTVEGYCADRVTCDDHGDCPSGMWCGAEGVCFRPTQGACRTEADCAPTELCVEDFCRDPADVCQFDYQCGLSTTGDARACVDNACSVRCDEDADCLSSGTSCQAGYCVPDRTECTSHDQCLAGEACILGRCLESCVDDGVCERPHDVCAADGYCRPAWAPTPLCTTNDDCQMGSACVDGVCRVPCPEAPLTCLNIDVQLTHCNEATGYCETEVERTPECFAGSDCDADERCVNATCRNR